MGGDAVFLALVVRAPRARAREEESVRACIVFSFWKTEG